MSEQTEAPQYWDLISKRDVNGQPYLRDAKLMVDQDMVEFVDGFAHNVPTYVVEKLGHRTDLQVVPAADPPAEVPVQHMSPASRPEAARPAESAGGPSVAKQLRQAMAGTGATPVEEEPEVAVGEIDPATGHRKPPGKPELSNAEKWDRARQALEETKAQGEALEGELVEGANGGPVFVPAGVKPGETPGWPTDDEGRPLELTPEQHEALAAGEPLEAAPPAGEGEGEGEGEPPAETPQPPPIPQGFTPTLESGERRCLAAKGDGEQCSNAAKDGTWACAHPAHQEKVQKLYADATA